MKIKIALYSDKGRRDNQEDAGGAFTMAMPGAQPTQMCCLGVYDGVCGNEGGEIASRMACTVSHAAVAAHLAVLGSGSTPPSHDAIARVLTTSLQQANEAIVRTAEENPQLKGMATTAVVAVIVEDLLHVASAGDSRCYRVGRHQIQQITRDHTEINRLLSQGQIRPDKVPGHPLAHVINNFLGQPGDFVPETYCCRLNPGDAVICCTDGVTDVVTDQEILALVNRCRRRRLKFQDLPQRLVELALSKGTGDNCTVVACECLPEPSCELPMAGRTLTGAYPAEAARVLRRLKECTYA